MKSVLISIQPKWCELIANGKKTIEVRKTKPKLETPFKVYIYCTKPKDSNDLGLCLDKGMSGNLKKVGLVYKRNYEAANQMNMPILSGKVIGEFVCNQIDTYDDDTIHAFSREDYSKWNDFDLYNSCIHPEDFEHYANDNWLYGWHISNLVIYDKPRELREFIVPSKTGCVNEGKCRGCAYLDCGNGFNVEDDCSAPFDTDEYKPLRRPPQSWCYVESEVTE